MPKKDGFLIQIDGVLDLRRKLLAAAGAASNLKPAFREVAEGLRGHAGRQFDTKGGEGGTAWRPLAPATLAKRRKRKGYYRRLRVSGSKPLQATGRLKRSFTKKGAKHVEQISNAEMEWGSKHPLAHLHAQGVASRGPAPPLPQRQILSFRDSAQRDALTVEPIRKHVLAGLGS